MEGSGGVVEGIPLNLAVRLWQMRLYVICAGAIVCHACKAVCRGDCKFENRTTFSDMQEAQQYQCVIAGS